MMMTTMFEILLDHVVVRRDIHDHYYLSISTEAWLNWLSIYYLLMNDWLCCMILILCSYRIRRWSFLWLRRTSLYSVTFVFNLIRAITCIHGQKLMRRCAVIDISTVWCCLLLLSHLLVHSTHRHQAMPLFNNSTPPRMPCHKKRRAKLLPAPPSSLPRLNSSAYIK